MGGWVVLITGVLLLVFTLISHFNLKTARMFEAEDRRVVAKITDKEKIVRRDPDGNDKVSYWLTLEFVTGLGEAVTVRQSELDSLKPTDIIHIYQGPKRSWWVEDVGERAEFIS